MEYKDYYQILGIPRDADDATIKRAFRRLAREHHPDVSADKAAATERFKEINEAYTVLSDGEKRRRYDSFDASWSQFRSGGASSGPQRTQGQAWPPPGYGQRRAEGSRRSGTRTIDPEDIERIFQAFGWAYSQRRAAGREGTSRTSDFSDFFENLFGGSGQSAAWPRGRDVSVTAQITLEEAYRGTTRVLEYGGGPRIEVTIPRGVQNGTQLRLQGLGQRPLFGTAGDLFVEIELLPHARLRRAGDNLHVEVPVEEQVASQSGRVKVPTIDRSVWLSIPTGTRDGQIFRLRGLGMPARANPAQHGDLFATVRITKHSRPRGRVLDFLRRLLERPILKSVAGLALVGVGLLAFMGQLLSGGSVGWLLVLATSLLLFVWALPSRSQAGILLALTFLAGSALLAASAKLPPAQLFSQGWPLLPMAGGYLLLRDGSQA